MIEPENTMKSSKKKISKRSKEKQMVQSKSKIGRIIVRSRLPIRTSKTKRVSRTTSMKKRDWNKTAISGREWYLMWRYKQVGMWDSAMWLEWDRAWWQERTILRRKGQWKEWCDELNKKW
jgi:hypothetical protein